MVRASLTEKGNYRVQGTVILEIAGATHKNRTMVFTTTSRTTHQTAVEALGSGRMIQAAGVLDTGFQGRRFTLRLRATTVQPWEAP